MKRPKKGPVLAAVALASVMLGAYLPLSGSLSKKQDDVPVYQVERQEFVQRVPAQGTFKAARATPVSVPMTAPGPFRIAWMAPDGARVKAGEVVVRFDPSEIEKRLSDAEDDLDSARLRMEKERVHGDTELRKLQHDIEMARVELEDAHRFQKKDQEIFSRNAIIESEVDSTLAKERERHAQEARRTQGTLSGTERELLDIEIRRADDKIRQARQALSGLEVAAPHDGVLVLERDWRGNPVRVGDSVWNGQPLAEIPDLSTMNVEVFVLEADAGGLAPGKPATVSLESAPGVAYQGKIARVDSLARPRMRGSPVQYFSVMLALDRTDPKVMKPGQRVRSTLRLEERKGALVVPRQAVFEREGKTVVYRQSQPGASFQPVEVKLGPSGMGKVVIESGLSPGDRVALADPNRPAEEPEDRDSKDDAGGGPKMAPLT